MHDENNRVLDIIPMKKTYHYFVISNHPESLYALCMLSGWFYEDLDTYHLNHASSYWYTDLCWFYEINLLVIIV